MLSIDQLPPETPLIISRADLEEFAFRILNGASSLDAMEDIIGSAEVCTITGMARSTLYGLTAKRCIPHFKSGKKLYFRRSEIHAWMLQNRRNTQTDLPYL